MACTITIDGPAGSGKSTVSRGLAHSLHFVYLDTGAMYRAVALAAGQEGIALNDGKRLKALCAALNLRFVSDGHAQKLLLNNVDVSEAIRSPEMDIAASTVSKVKVVREALSELQRQMARGINVVAEGRDMGTVVFPDAAYKFFLTADPEVRVERRFLERRNRGEAVSKDAVREELIKRDDQDQNRALSPLRAAADAVVIDSTALSMEMVLENIAAKISC